MADTVRTEAELLTIFADNTSGDISPQDTRDLIVSVYKTDADIKAQYEANPDTNAFTDADESKLDGIEANATIDQTDSEIKIAYEANADTNAFTDAEKTKLAGLSGAATFTFASRAAAVSSPPSSPSDGNVMFDGQVMYVADSTATAISDLTGWLPFLQITPLHFGADNSGNIDNFVTMDALADSTSAFSAMFAYSPVGSSSQETHYVIPQGVYAATTLIISNKVRFTIEWENAVIYGKSTVTAESIFHFHNAHRVTQWGRARFTSDGNRTVPLYATFYDSGVRLTSNTTGSGAYPLGTSPTSQFFWDGLEVSQMPGGVLSGNPLGDAQHHEEAQDSIIFSKFYSRSIMLPVYQNVPNSGMQVNGIIITQQFSASSNWWDYNNSYTIRSDEGRMIHNGGVTQKANTLGYTYYGADFQILGVSYESSAPNQIVDKDWFFSDIDRGFCAGTVNPIFQVSSGAEGVLTIEDCTFRRILESAIESDTPPGTSVNFMEADDTPDYKVVITNSIFKEFYFEPLQGVSGRDFVLGGDLTLSNVQIQNTSGFKSYSFGPDPSIELTTADANGSGMTSTPNLSAKVGWTATNLTGGNFHRETVDLPTGVDAAITIESVGTAGFISTPTAAAGFPVKSGKDYLMKMQYKRRTGFGTMQVLVGSYNFGGTGVGTTDQVWGKNNADHVAQGLTDWNRVNVPIKAADGAHFMQLNVQASAVAIESSFTNIG